jgi:succinate-semialdehyde dehydrogenase/glutarate-semialdehyde dehydrogenase
MKVADGFEPGAVVGPPSFDMKAVEKAQGIADALKKGVKVVTGGKRAAQGGSFFEPTVLTDVTTDMVITKEETFGPVAPLYRFKSEDEAVKEAVKMANGTEFGLASYFYSRDIGRIWRVAEAPEYGIVGINEGIISTEIAPFGGREESGIGPSSGPLGLEIRHRGIPRSQIPLHGRHRWVRPGAGAASSRQFPRRLPE